MNGSSISQPSDPYRIYQGLGMLLRFDRYLLENNLSERSITHKLGEHYQFQFNEWNVDCEYNRNLGGPKQITIDPRHILNQMADKISQSDNLLHNFQRQEEQLVLEDLQSLEGQLRDPELEFIEELDVVLFVLTLSNGSKVKETIYPDIIIHHRGTRDNYIVIEAKKSINRNPMARAYDLVKLMTLVSSPDFNYQCGYFIDLPIGSDLNRFNQFSPPNKFVEKVYKIIPI